jgi:hypothetical protein
MQISDFSAAAALEWPATRARLRSKSVRKHDFIVSACILILRSKNRDPIRLELLEEASIPPLRL